jgi:PTH1 family peptidyl-tRNA hydrolase
VVSDDFNLPAGTLRLRREGSDGGHKGLQSIISELGTKAFPRLRLGIGPVPEGMDPADYVLGPITDMEQTVEMVKRAARGIERLLEEGFDKAQSWLNSVPETESAGPPPGLDRFSSGS